MNLHFSAFIVIELLPNGRLDETAGRTLSHKGNVVLLLGVNNARNTIDCSARAGEGARGEDLVSGSQFGPRLVCPAVVVLSLGDLHVLVKAQDLPRLQFGNCGPLTQLQRKRRFSCQPKLLRPQSRASAAPPHLPRQPPLDLSNLSLSVSLVFG